MHAHAQLKLALFAVITLTLPVLQAAPQWKRLESEHFEMFTTTREGRAQELLDHFERVRQFFIDSSGTKSITSLPVRIIVLSSRKDWEKYRVAEHAAAFFHPGITRDFIVMSGESDEILTTATHEFTHIIIRHSGSDLPLWLNEGIAELYSNLRADGDKVRVGGVLEGRAYTLGQTKWMEIGSLLAADHNSPHYTEKNRVGIFYAQSWLLTHMLFLSEQLRPKAAAFLNAVAGGKASEEAFASTYGLIPSQLDDQLEDYYRAGRINVALLPVRLPKQSLKVEAIPATPVQQAACEALLLAFVKKHAESLELLEKLAKENPSDIEVAEALTEAAWQSGDHDKGKLYAEHALQLGSRNQALAWRFAEHLAVDDLTSDRLLNLLRDVVKNDPAKLDARLLLVDVLSARQDYAGVLEAARPVRQIEPKHATRFFAALAVARWMTGDQDNARKELERAMDHAKAPQQRQRCESIEEFFDRQAEIAVARQEMAEIARQQALHKPQPEPEPEPAPVKSQPSPPPEPKKIQTRLGPAEDPLGGAAEHLQQETGFLAALQCMGKTSVLIVKLENGSYLRLLVDDPKHVTVEGAGNRSFDLPCGGQKPLPVTVEYHYDSKLSENGMLRILRFGKRPDS